MGSSQYWAQQRLHPPVLPPPTSSILPCDPREPEALEADLAPARFLFSWGILVPRPGIEPTPLAVKACSPNHQIAREFPTFGFLHDNHEASCLSPTPRPLPPPLPTHMASPAQVGVGTGSGGAHLAHVEVEEDPCSHLGDEDQQEEGKVLGMQSTQSAGSPPCPPHHGCPHPDWARAPWAG